MTEKRSDKRKFEAQKAGTPRPIARALVWMIGESVSERIKQKHHPDGWCFLCVRVTKRSKIEVRVSKSILIFGKTAF